MSTWSKTAYIDFNVCDKQNLYYLIDWAIKWSIINFSFYLFHSFLITFLGYITIFYLTVPLVSFVPRGGFRGAGDPPSPLLRKKFGCLYRESLKRDSSGPPLRSASGPPLMNISGSATAQINVNKSGLLSLWQPLVITCFGRYTEVKYLI